MEERWEVTVSSSGSPTLLKAFFERVDSRLIFDRDSLKIEPSQLQHHQQSDAVYEHAQKIIAIENRAARFLTPGLTFSINAVLEEVAGKPPTQYLFVEGYSALGVSSFAYLETFDTSGKKVLPAKWSRDVLDQEVVQHVLDILANLKDEDWTELYKVIELLQNDNAALAEWQMKGRLSLISHYACSPAAAGRGARHAVQKGSPPQVSMSFSEATGYVRAAVAKWIDAKSLEV